MPLNSRGVKPRLEGQAARQTETSAGVVLRPVSARLIRTWRSSAGSRRQVRYPVSLYFPKDGREGVGFEDQLLAEVADCLIGLLP